MPFFDALRSAMLGDLHDDLVAPALRLELLRLRFDRSHKSHAKRLLLQAGLQLTLRAYEGREPVVFTSLFVPPEITHALGLVPFGLDAAGAVTASLGMASQCLAAADRAWAPVDSCSVLRAALGASQLKLLPRPRAVVCTSTLCDSTAKVCERVARDSGDVPFRLLDVPPVASPPAVAYLADQLEELARELAAMTGRRLEPSRLAEAIRLSNEAREHLSALHALRRTRASLLSAADALSFVYPLALLLGSEAGAAVFRTYHAEMAAAARRSAPEPIGRRLLWLHLLPYYPSDLLDTIERAGAVVVCEEVSQVYWEEMDPQRPFIGLARRCIDHYSNGPLERRLEKLAALAREHRIDGAVHFSHHGCRQSWGALRVVRDVLAEAGVPLLEIEGDLVDARGRAEGQHRTRMEAFLETLA